MAGKSAETSIDEDKIEVPVEASKRETVIDIENLSCTGHHTVKVTTEDNAEDPSAVTRGRISKIPAEPIEKKSSEDRENTVDRSNEDES